MNWLNLETSLLDSEEFIGCSPVERATWICLLRYCAGQENGGRINDCAGWHDRRWQQLARVTKDEVHTACALWSWDGSALVVWQYPTDRENEVRSKRDGGRKTVAKRWAHSSANSSANSSAINSADTEGEGEEKRREREGKEKEKEIQEEEAGPATPPAAAIDAPSLALTSEPPASPAKAKRAPKQPPQTDAEWLASLSASPAYAGLDVQREYAKAGEWCRVRTQTLSRQRFVNWLNRADRTLATPNGTATSRRSFSDGNDYSHVGY